MVRHEANLTEKEEHACNEGKYMSQFTQPKSCVSTHRRGKQRGESGFPYLQDVVSSVMRRLFNAQRTMAHTLPSTELARQLLLENISCCGLSPKRHDALPSFCTISKAVGASTPCRGDVSSHGTMGGGG